MSDVSGNSRLGTAQQLLRATIVFTCGKFILSFHVDDNHFHPHRLCSFLSAIGCHDMPLWQICCFLCKPEDLNSYGGIKRLKLHKQEKQIVCTPSNPPQEGNESLSEISKDPFSMDSKNVAGSAELGTLDHAFKKRKTGEHSCFPVFVHSNEQNVGWGLPADDCPQPPTVPSQEPLTSWSCYYWHMGIKPSSPIALLLHFPLTLYLGFCMSRESRLNIHQQMPNANLRIHYLGPREELSILEIFQELLHLIPGSQSYTLFQKCLPDITFSCSVAALHLFLFCMLHNVGYLSFVCPFRC